MDNLEKNVIENQDLTKAFENLRNLIRHSSGFNFQVLVSYDNKQAWVMPEDLKDILFYALKRELLFQEFRKEEGN